MRTRHRQTVPLSSVSLIPLTLGNDPLSLKLLLLSAMSVNNKICLVQDLNLDEGVDLVECRCTSLDLLARFPGIAATMSTGMGRWSCNGLSVSTYLTEYLVQQSTGFECFCVMLEELDRIGIMLYHPPIAQHSPCLS